MKLKFKFLKKKKENINVKTLISPINLKLDNQYNYFFLFFTLIFFTISYEIIKR